MHRSERPLVDVGEFTGCCFLDDRACLTVALTAARRLREGGGPAGDVHFVFTTSEELGGVGASYASRTLPGDVTLALDVGPAGAEYGTTLGPAPIVAHGDAAGVHDASIADHLLRLGRELGRPPAPAVFSSFESDASRSKAKGLAPRAALLCLPTLSTHGYEVIHREAVEACADLLTAYLQRPVP